MGKFVVQVSVEIELLTKVTDGGWGLPGLPTCVWNLNQSCHESHSTILDKIFIEEDCNYDGGHNCWFIAFIGLHGNLDTNQFGRHFMSLKKKTILFENMIEQ